ncbi:MAG: TetR/AcrR family transcriptional regulator C-terminal domain-containing protein [Lachnospiraceae bacterium]
MADSTLTKRALASALKELMMEIPFEKINIAQICERCNMNRKSFYYHFKDKYDLVNWIFDIDFITVLDQYEEENCNVDVSNRDYWVFIEKLYRVFYENRSFYRKALAIQGQNSFLDHFRECMQPLFIQRLSIIYGQKKMDSFSVSLLADLSVDVLNRWLLEKDCMPPEQLMSILKSLSEAVASTLCNEFHPSHESV